VVWEGALEGLGQMPPIELIGGAGGSSPSEGHPLLCRLRLHLFGGSANQISAGLFDQVANLRIQLFQAHALRRYTEADCRFDDGRRRLNFCGLATTPMSLLLSRSSAIV
jgi:hypothetical protein